MPKINWWKAAAFLKPGGTDSSARRTDNDDDDDMPGPSASAVVGWLPFLKPQQTTRLQPA